MYFRLKKTRTTPVLQLVSAYRDIDGRPRQKILISLGNIDIPQSLWRTLAEEIENHLNKIATLFEPSEEIVKWRDMIIKKLQTSEKKQTELPKEVLVNPSDITVEDVRELGPELIAQKAWDELKMDSILEKSGFSPIQRRDAALTVINRLCEPVSEHVIPGWLNTTALSDIYNNDFSGFGDDRFYRISDSLVRNKNQIEDLLSIQEQNLFNLDRSIYLYDLTNTYFEGVMKSNDFAKRGHSKEKRTDAPLISVGLVLDKQGFIVNHKMYEGNISEASTLKEIVSDLAKKETKKPTIIMDSGISSKENLEIIKELGFDYITVGKRPSRLAFHSEFEDISKFKTIKNSSNQDIYIKTLQTEDEKLIACISKEREKKEEAILSKSETKYLEALKKLQTSIEKGRIKDSKKIQIKIGRLKERHHRISRYYNIIFEKELSWERKEAEYKKAKEMTGSYILRSSRRDLSDEEIWHLYIMLTKVENGFRTLKSELGLRPVYHQKKERGEGHVFITILAYHLLHFIETKIKDSGKSMSFRAIRRLVQTHSYNTIVIPTKNSGILRIRKPSTPDIYQKEIYELLGIEYKNLPETAIKSI